MCSTKTRVNHKREGLQQAGAQQQERGGGITRMTANEVVQDDNCAAGLENNQCR